jgi:bis(5'-nucleosyl)-tetraphosphatase (symmetrical)
VATWAIGDVQGCATTLERLLARLAPARSDRLLFCGDLVNRGARSLDALRLVRSLAERAVAVLGNHDLHLLARAHGVAARRPKDTLEEVLDAPDRDELLAWLIERPLLHREADGTVVVHAGLHPAWSADEAERRARAAEASLRRDPTGFLAAFTKDESAAEDARVLTRIRTVKEDGALCSFGGPPVDAPAGCAPWFAAKERRSAGTRVVFGHWSALGLRIAPDTIGLDTGCVWGRTLTAVSLETADVVQEPQASEDRANADGRSDRPHA